MTGLAVTAAVIATTILVLEGLRQLSKQVRVASDESSCAGCGYQVNGLPSFECPECGSDLREVGIATRRTRGGCTSPASVGVLWTVITAVFGVALIDGLSNLPRVRLRSTDWAQMLAPQSSPATTVQLSASAAGAAGHPADRVAITVEVPGGEVAILELERRSNVWQVRRQVPTAGSESIALEEASFVQWLSSAGLDTTRPEVQAESVDLFNRIEALKLDASAALFPLTRRFSTLHGSTSGSTAQAAWFHPTAYLVLASVWLTGVYIVLAASNRARSRRAVVSGSALNSAATDAGTPATPPGSP